MPRRIPVAKPSDLEQVSRLIANHFGEFCAHPAPLEPQYCTTNSVIATGNFVLKRYKHRAAFHIEKAILEAHDRFSFQTPAIVLSHESESLGCWNVLLRVPGHTLATELPPRAFLGLVVDKMVRAVEEFESGCRTFVDIEFSRWGWVRGMEFLAEWCLTRQEVFAATTLLEVASLSDEVFASSEVVPCFDLYARNVIWNVSDSSVDVVFIDFDKANRLMPRGEQLSHFATTPGLRPFLRQALLCYSGLTGMGVAETGRIVNVAAFFRALSGVRDSLPWDSSEDGTSVDPHGAVRSHALRYSFAKARQLIPEFVAALGERESFERRLLAAFSGMATAIRMKS